MGKDEVNQSIFALSSQPFSSFKEKKKKVNLFCIASTNHSDWAPVKPKSRNFQCHFTRDAVENSLEVHVGDFKRCVHALLMGKCHVNYSKLVVNIFSFCFCFCFLMTPTASFSYI